MKILTSKLLHSLHVEIIELHPKFTSSSLTSAPLFSILFVGLARTFDHAIICKCDYSVILTFSLPG